MPPGCLRAQGGRTNPPLSVSRGQPAGPGLGPAFPEITRAAAALGVEAVVDGVMRPVRVSQTHGVSRCTSVDKTRSPPMVRGAKEGNRSARSSYGLPVAPRGIGGTHVRPSAATAWVHRVGGRDDWMWVASVPTVGGAAAEPVRVRGLTDQDGQRLQQIVRRGSTSSVRYRWAMLLLASAGGNTVPVIAQLVRADEDTVRDVVHRFNDVGLACLDPQCAGGRPRLLKPGDEEFAIQTATTRPAKLGQPFTRWYGASWSPICGFTARSFASAGRHYAAYPPTAASPSSAPGRGRSPRTRNGRRSRTGSRKCSTISRTGCSPSTSSARSGSGPAPTPAGPVRVSRTGCPPPTTEPMTCGTSTTATRSATTVCGVSTAVARAP
ncbi:Transposase [Streptomyces sp. PpalLS-921]|nr:Transposase [Streptomyces sp. PpalLS-921]